MILGHRPVPHLKAPSICIGIVPPSATWVSGVYADLSFGLWGVLETRRPHTQAYPPKPSELKLAAAEMRR